MFGSVRDERVHSVRGKALTELRIGASIKRKLHELEKDAAGEDPPSNNPRRYTFPTCGSFCAPGASTTQTTPGWGTLSAPGTCAKRSDVTRGHRLVPNSTWLCGFLRTYK